MNAIANLKKRFARAWASTERVFERDMDRGGKPITAYRWGKIQTPEDLSMLYPPSWRSFVAAGHMPSLHEATVAQWHFFKDGVALGVDGQFGLLASENEFSRVWLLFDGNVSARWTIARNGTTKARQKAKPGWRCARVAGNGVENPRFLTRKGQAISGRNVFGFYVMTSEMSERNGRAVLTMETFLSGGPRFLGHWELELSAERLRWVDGDGGLALFEEEALRDALAKVKASAAAASQENEGGPAEQAGL